MKIRLLIADDHSIVREGLKQLLALYDDIELMAEAVDGDHLLTILEQQQPDILTLDILMPGLSGIPLIETIAKRYPELPILILSMHNETQIARRTIRAGARGYLSKDCDANTLIAGIRKLAQGGRYIQSDVAEKLAFDFDEAIDTAKHDSLSKREFHIFCLLARGLSVNEIAEELCISNKTVSTHKFRLMQKMSFTSHTEIVRYALAHNLIK
ncbi:DNA-binding response regulator [Pokkaliibacter plantistimulans]|uniref:DNA-binding response regulator n=1 Tax=Proteobacteria bacterium 228 TaxID=2083153 RepID=A0A2S5KQB7_9PROT|nr:response regulator transcription factor [Pokkaliibacter plantistimulans]PPC77031.1 DNA-binding response regulator [Pokkaliibacter plantistimulans]